MCVFCGLSSIISVTLQSRLFILGYGKTAEKMMTSWFSKYTRVTHVRENEEEEEYGSLSEGGWVYGEKGGRWSLGAAIWLQSRRNEESSARQERKG